jgi:plasmid stabilization system protein ParE
VSHRVVFTPEAQDDLLDLYDYIADHSSPTRALRYINASRSFVSASGACRSEERGATICVPDCV